ncbi:DJ-1/PfpI family protein [Actinomycetospora rhizophila]|uniref:DJ-1/PfpI family protein n=2 Tax=Actinomycetospora rhizophila TaxID=1416876 RepID=A0ABV9ZE56_9PSEU
MRLRTVLARLAVALLILAVPAVGAAIAAPATFAAIYAPGPPRAVPPPAPLPHDPTRPTAVVVLGLEGTEVSDVLAPYEVLAATGRLNVYTVAAERRPVTLTGGLDLVPDLSFDALAALVGVPDLVVVPAMADVGEPTDAPVAAWLRAQRGAQYLAICNGSGVLAASGVLDGRTATAHRLGLAGFEAQYPAVRWVRGERVVDGGDVVSTAGVLSGIAGTLRLVEHRFGPEVAAGAAAAIGWDPARGDLPLASGPAVPGPAAVVNAGFRWRPASLGVLLTDGVGEVELASVFDVHGGQSLAARTTALSPDGGPVRSRHGLVFLPRGDVGAAAGLDRLLVSGHGPAVAVPGGVTPVAVHAGSGFAYDQTITDLARTTDVATARWTATTLELPLQGSALEGPAWPWAPTAVPVVLIAAGGLLWALVARHRARGRTGATNAAERSAGTLRPQSSITDRCGRGRRRRLAALREGPEQGNRVAPGP